MRLNPFKFEPPAWANTKGEPLDARQALQRAHELAHSYYPLATQTQIHSMIEWCGVMSEYVRMLGEAARQGLDPREVDQHGSVVVTVPDYMVQYFCEKLGCQLKPFIRGANRAVWRHYIDLWFESGEPPAASRVGPPRRASKNAEQEPVAPLEDAALSGPVLEWTQADPTRSS